MERPKHPPKDGEEFGQVDLGGSNDLSTVIDPGQVDQVVDHAGQVVRGPSDEGHLPLLLAGEFAVRPVDQQASQAQDRGQRRPQLVAHLGEESPLHLADPPERLGPFVQLDVERQDHAGGLRQLPVELAQPPRLGLAVVEGLEQFLILADQLVDRRHGFEPAQSLDDPVQIREGPRTGRTLAISTIRA